MQIYVNLKKVIFVLQKCLGIVLFSHALFLGNCLRLIYSLSSSTYCNYNNQYLNILISYLIYIAAKDLQKKLYLKILLAIFLLYDSGSQNRGHDPFEGRQMSKYGRQI